MAYQSYENYCYDRTLFKTKLFHALYSAIRNPIGSILRCFRLKILETEPSEPSVFWQWALLVFRRFIRNARMRIPFFHPPPLVESCSDLAGANVGRIRSAMHGLWSYPSLHGPLPAFLPARVFRVSSGLRRAGLCGTDPGSLRFLPAFADACRPGSRSVEPSGTPADAVHRFIYRCESPPHAILRLSATPFSPAGARHRCLSSLLSRPIRFRVGSPPPTARSGIVKNFLNFDCYSFHNSESFFTFVASKDVRFCDVRTLG